MRKTEKEKNLPKEHISTYKDYKVISTLRKPKSPLTILYCTNDPDEWFIRKITFMTRSGMISDAVTLIQKDLSGSINFYGNDGFEISKDNLTII